MTGLHNTVRGTSGGVGVARVGRIGAENHQLQIHADLRRRQARAIDRRHGLKQVAHQLVQFVRVECGDRLGDPQQARITHPQNFTHGHRSSPGSNGHQVPAPSSNASRPASSSTLTPNSRALSSLLPASAPATT
jgi:hypothetical protein